MQSPHFVPQRSVFLISSGVFVFSSSANFSFEILKQTQSYNMAILSTISYIRAFNAFLPAQNKRISRKPCKNQCPSKQCKFRKQINCKASTEYYSYHWHNFCFKHPP